MMRSIKGHSGLTRGRGMHETVKTVWINTVRECDCDPESGLCLNADNGMFTSVLVDDDVDWEIEETVIS